VCMYEQKAPLINIYKIVQTLKLKYFKEKYEFSVSNIPLLFYASYYFVIINISCLVSAQLLFQ
jgi:hypothetical protein